MSDKQAPLSEQTAIRLIERFVGLEKDVKYVRSKVDQQANTISELDKKIDEAKVDIAVLKSDVNRFTGNGLFKQFTENVEKVNDGRLQCRAECNSILSHIQDQLNQIKLRSAFSSGTMKGKAIVIGAVLVIARLAFEAGGYIYKFLQAASTNPNWMSK